MNENMMPGIDLNVEPDDVGFQAVVPVKQYSWLTYDPDWTAGILIALERRRRVSTILTREDAMNWLSQGTRPLGLLLIAIAQSGGVIKVGPQDFGRYNTTVEIGDEPDTITVTVDRNLLSDSQGENA